MLVRALAWVTPGVWSREIVCWIIFSFDEAEIHFIVLAHAVDSVQPVAIVRAILVHLVLETLEARVGQLEDRSLGESFGFSLGHRCAVSKI